VAYRRFTPRYLYLQIEYGEKLLANQIDLHKIDDFSFCKDEVKSMIENYVKCTKSKEASLILENWKNEKDNFIVVFPKDYKRVLKEKKEV
jgi:glutamate synthase domain-containing protein 3